MEKRGADRVNIPHPTWLWLYGLISVVAPLASVQFTNSFLHIIPHPAGHHLREGFLGLLFYFFIIDHGRRLMVNGGWSVPL